MRCTLMDGCPEMWTELAELLGSLPALGITTLQVKPETRPVPIPGKQFRPEMSQTAARIPSLLGPVQSGPGALPSFTFTISCAIRGAGRVQLAVHVA